MPNSDQDDPIDRRAALAKVIPRRAAVSWWVGLVLAVGFAALVTPVITADQWLLRFHVGTISEHAEAPFTVRAPMFTGYDNLRIGGGVVVARGETATRAEAAISDEIAAAMPRGPALYFALFALVFALAAVFSHHMRRSVKGRLIRVQVVSLAVIALLAVAVKIMLLSTALSVLVVPVAALAMVPTIALDRIVGLATGVLGALILSMLAPFDIGLAILLLVPAATAGLVISERLKRRWLAALTTGLATTLCTAAMYLLLTYLSTGHAPGLTDPLHSAWIAAAFGPALAALITVPLLPLYQLLVGEITQGRLFALEDLGNPLLRQIAEKAPGTWQHSLMMANLAEIAANAIGASGRLVRVGAYYHDLGKSLQAKYFIENLEPGEPSPHDQLPPEVSCDAIFAHVTEGIVAARKAGLHERIVDFMHMHHGNGVLEYFWAKCREHGNPHGFTIEQFRYPGHPPQSRETAILAICDAVEAASRTLHKPDPQAIDSLVQRIVYGKLHLGQLDESGLSMSDLRKISDSLRETIRHANHGRIEYPWQKARQDASATSITAPSHSQPRLDSLDRRPAVSSPAMTAPAMTAPAMAAAPGDDPLATTADLGHTTTAPQPGSPIAQHAAEPSGQKIRPPTEAPTTSPTSITAGQSGNRTARGTERGLPLVVQSPAPVAGAAEPVAPPERAPVTLPARPNAAHDAEPTPPRAERAASVQAAAPPARLTTMASPAMPASLASLAPPNVLPQATGVMPPIEADDAQSPAIKRGPSGHPAVPSDPAQLAAALAALATRVGAAPFGGQSVDELARTGTRMPEVGNAVAAAALAPPPSKRDADPAVTQPMIPTMGMHADFDGAILQPPHTPAPVIATPRGSSPLPRTTGLTDEGRLRVPDTWRGQGEPREPVNPRRTTPPAVAATSEPAAADDAAATILRLTPDAAKTVPRLPLDTIKPVQSAEAAKTVPRLALEAIRMSGSGAKTIQQLPVDAVKPPPTSTPAPTDAAATVPAMQAYGVISTTRSPSEAAKTVPHVPVEVFKPTFSTPQNAAVTVPAMPAADVISSARPPGAARLASPAALAAAAVDGGITEPSLPAMARDAAQAIPADRMPSGSGGWSRGLAERIDAALESDQWSVDTPVVAPTRAEIRSLLGQPDPTRLQSIDEIERLHRHAAALVEGPGLAEPHRRSPHPTAEVDPDDIEAAIELAPPARRPTHVNAIGVAKKKPKKE